MKEAELPGQDEVFKFSETFRVEGNVVIGETHVVHCCADMAKAVFTTDEYSYGHTSDHLGIEYYFRLERNGVNHHLLTCPFCHAKLPTWISAAD